MPGEPEYYNQVSESIKLIFDLTSRIDERVKMLVEQHHTISDRIEKLHERHEGILNRIVVLENKNGSEVKHILEDMKEQLEEVVAKADILEEKVHQGEVKMAGLEIYNNQHINKWKIAGEFVFKVIMLGIGAFLTWKVTSGR
jgi:hypothetical protein